jgi:transcriptional regulator
MYSPSFYKENRSNLIAKVIAENSLATIVTAAANGELTVTHLPLILKTTSNDKLELWGHMARANQHWQELATRPAKIIFNGPNAYITPAWYVEKTDNVPTWNYVTVHATGDFEVISEAGAALNDLQTVITEFEKNYGSNWQLAESKPGVVHNEVTAMLQHIVVFRFKNVKFDAKFKLGQRLDFVSRETTIAELKALGEEKSDTSFFDLADYMELTRPTKPT